MEVAGQWRKEWAGTAEYGNVTEGGVTRRVARAMEVLNSSGPNSRMRVVRAAYHSTAGAGLPASSFLMHSSRSVFKSGFNFLESPTSPTKPLEISSIPMDSHSPELKESFNYKVTEPDDTEISEPSKWVGSTDGKSVRMPSEESSSAENASIIDLDPRTYNKNSLSRKYSYDSDSSDVKPVRRNSARASPLLDAPVALSTLKYKSLLNGNNDWTSRRKSYSFEDSPLSETVSHSNDTLAMESSTDSGICKSSELVNDDSKGNSKNEGSFQNWLSKHRANAYSKPSPTMPRRNFSPLVESPAESNIVLQSAGKVSITIPIRLETDEDYNNKKTQEFDEYDRRTKRVEFCKTELHFAAESNRVNIIETDEKPPPTNDFRRRRSAFVPISQDFEKPITLFGDVQKPFINKGIYSNGDNVEIEDKDSVTTTRSILKNKIPKPKPYLLGENMTFGEDSTEVTKNNDNHVSAISLINKQLQSNIFSNGTPIISSEDEMINNSIHRNSQKSPTRKYYTKSDSTKNVEKKTVEHYKPVINDHKIKMSPTPVRPKTRPLRDSDLTYFGVNSLKKNNIDYKEVKQPSSNRIINNNSILQSVQLIKQVSNSVCNSEAESEDNDYGYQNLPIKKNFAPVPVPRPRTKIEKIPNERILQPIAEKRTNTQEKDDNRRSRSRRVEQTTTYSNRSISEPPKPKDFMEYRRSKEPISIRSRKESASTERKQYGSNLTNDNSYTTYDEIPEYINVSIEEETIPNKQLVQKENKYLHRSSSLKKNDKKTSENDSYRKKTLTKTDSENERKKSTNKNESPKSERDIILTSRHRSSRRDVIKNGDIKDKNKPVNTEHAINSTRRLLNSENQCRESKTKEKKEVMKIEKPHDTYEKTSRTLSKDRTHSSSPNNFKRGDSTHRSINTKNKDDDYKMRNHKPDKHRQSRSEFVINYDDKNGTVSSICKVKHGQNTSSVPKKKKTPHDKLRDTDKKQKASDKAALLQHQDPDWYQHPIRPPRKRKTKIRSCQLL